MYGFLSCKYYKLLPHNIDLVDAILQLLGIIIIIRNDCAFMEVTQRHKRGLFRKEKMKSIAHINTAVNNRILFKHSLLTPQIIKYTLMHAVLQRSEGEQ